jgi:hypothetical protein
MMIRFLLSLRCSPRAIITDKEGTREYLKEWSGVESGLVNVVTTMSSRRRFLLWEFKTLWIRSFVLWREKHQSSSS